MSSEATSRQPFTLQEYLRFLDFSEGIDPFASVNARDEREVLESYFVAPPYFETLWGNPAEPQSSIILAPTGAGKTALAVMIDERAADMQPIADGRLPVLTVLYDDFSRLSLSQENQDLAAHLSAINYLLVLSLLRTIGNEFVPHFQVPSDERAIIRHCFARYAGGKVPAEIYQDLERIATPWEQFQRATKKVVHALPVVSLLAKALELGVDRLQAGIELAQAIADFSADTRSLNATPESDFHRLIGLLNRHYQAIYILVDRVDETHWTARDAQATYQLIHPLVSNLSLLDYPNRTFAFKFFLWDGIDDFYQEHSRPDRVFSRDLVWKPEQLVEMINRRVRAFSGGHVETVSDIFVDDLSFADVMAVPDLLAIFAGVSPRAIVTTCRYAVEEQVNDINHGNQPVTRITENAFVAAIKRFANDVAVRLIPNDRTRQDITSIRRVVFTTKSLNADVFRGHSPQAVQSKVGKWKKLGVFDTVGNELSGRQGFPTEVHALTNPSVAFARR
jgi:hypothetical protein